ncbi:MAG: S41 family peptidase [Steroidobacteraceae bacterium]
MRILTATLLLALSLAGCGGGGGGGGSTQLAPAWQSGVFQAASSFADKCAMPRSGTDPVTKTPYPDRAGTLLDEKNWLRSWNNDLYLWYSEVLDQNPANFATTLAYFDVLATTAVTPSGAPKDKFHFTYDTATWEALALTGSQAGYGAQWIILTRAPPRSVVVAYTELNSPATAPAANLQRGEAVIEVDGVNLPNATTQADIDILNAGLFPSAAGRLHTFLIQAPGGATRTISMISADVVAASVQNTKTITTTNGTVGYLLFNDHLATAERALYDAFTTLRAAHITDLVIDIRYNGGGYLDIASEVGYMVAGASRTSGKTFDLTQFNDKHPTTDPVTKTAITPMPFHTESLGFAAALGAGLPLPTLDLTRVFVLTGPDTCSASEAVINGLRGAGVEVIQIGSTTCGKPYGFYPTDNCGTTYFSIQFRGVNALNFGDYTDGFSPQNTVGVTGGTPVGVLLPGCSVGDDFSHQLGDPAEARLAEALVYSQNNTGMCTAPPSGISKSLRVQSDAAMDGHLPASPRRALMLPRPLN